ncbi:hypothetical protein [Heyndrickxia sporothermodurans]|uniref:Uncharacterized protein n=1 Tax=Heyndrickxia sporothermodurans TaxID=46224 RepID=A0AB37HE77_9BACI|nr:hypothetical protein [Heyndrickxia sporothermodurans]MBL5769092.1 hypothetical protein [Heyndrickxia sporothermodurans]MBL5772884.1 hypothetical protein [Heyndrickxia sporothermodurans]MBL5776394.1 hypothetical protein [Heyndrickxia sporothermodurans]MBL5780113.1 hypothetical protein [Heyndrickxia sporothermodurans]MBL5783710.1 hypothetical protein [Heyndrickxia sporothermodurans]
MSWLKNTGQKVEKCYKTNGKEYTHKTPIVNFLNLIFNSLSTLLDVREEWEKDRWDVRILYKKYLIDYNQSYQGYHIDFSKIKNEHIKRETKKYFKQRLRINPRILDSISLNLTLS